MTLFFIIQNSTLLGFAFFYYTMNCNDLRPASSIKQLLFDKDFSLQDFHETISFFGSYLAQKFVFMIHAA